MTAPWEPIFLSFTPLLITRDEQEKEIELFTRSSLNSSLEIFLEKSLNCLFTQHLERGAFSSPYPAYYRYTRMIFLQIDEEYEKIYAYSLMEIIRARIGDNFIRDIAGLIFSYLPKEEKIGRTWMKDMFDIRATIAVSLHGNIIYSSFCQIYVFSPDGNLLHTWKARENKYSYVRMSSSLHVSPSDEIFVRDADNYCAHVFTSTGTYLHTWEVARGAATDWVGNIAINADIIAVTDYYKRDISVKTKESSIKWELPKEGAPEAIALYDNSIYVTDIAHHRVLVYTQEGKLIRQWKVKGNEILAYPEHIAITSRDIFVSAGNCIQVYTHDGTWLRTFGQGDFKHIHSLAVSPLGKVYATDKHDAYIREYDMIYM